jgi:hypothetical protein
LQYPTESAFSLQFNELHLFSHFRGIFTTKNNGRFEINNNEKAQLFRNTYRVDDGRIAGGIIWPIVDDVALFCDTCSTNSWTLCGKFKVAGVVNSAWPRSWWFHPFDCVKLIAELVVDGIDSYVGMEDEELSSTGADFRPSACCLNETFFDVFLAGEGASTIGESTGEADAVELWASRFRFRALGILLDSLVLSADDSVISGEAAPLTSGDRLVDIGIALVSI